MSKDGLLPNSLVKFTLNSAPFQNQFVFMVFVSLFAGFVPVSDLGHMVSIGTLLLLCVCIV
jgi:APA family basic amino acid/polyamine antiporter